MVFSLALALVASAVVARSVMELRLARADLARSVAEYALDGAHLQAAASIVRAGEGGPYRWAFSTDVGWVEALAEPETPKVTPSDAATFPDETFAELQVSDVAALRSRLSKAQAFSEVAELDDSPVWKRCAPRLISGFGTGRAVSSAVPGEPRASVDPDWRVGEVWRVRIATATGWRDDRIVRFTGDARHPAATIRRRLSRSDRGEEQCDAILTAVAGRGATMGTP